MHSSGLTQRRQDSAAPDYPLGQLFPGPFPQPLFRTTFIRNDPRNEPRSCIKIELIDTGHMEPLSCGRKMRLLAELHSGRIARIRVAGGGAEGDAPDPQALALGLPCGQPQPPTRPSPSRRPRITVEFLVTMAQATAGCSAHHGQAVGHLLGVRLPRHWQFDEECGSLAGLRADGDRAAVLADDLAGDGKSQAGSA